MKWVESRLNRECLKEFSKKMRELEKQGDSATWDLHESSMSLKRIVDVFGNVISLQMIHKLWKPGIFTCQEIQKELGIDIKYVIDVKNHLKDLKIIEMQTRGIYGRGTNGQFVMNLFAWIVINMEEQDDGDEE
jgi:hypothetical protein